MAIVALGISWMIKGETLLRDETEFLKPFPEMTVSEMEL
jgi:hypothetical protein